jgi:hypothetical protein
VFLLLSSRCIKLLLRGNKCTYLGIMYLAHRVPNMFYRQRQDSCVIILMQKLCTVGFKKKRELSEKVLSDFIKFL